MIKYKSKSWNVPNVFERYQMYVLITVGYVFQNVIGFVHKSLNSLHGNSFPKVKTIGNWFHEVQICIRKYNEKYISN